jgi:polyferredoxin
MFSIDPMYLLVADVILIFHMLLVIFIGLGTLAIYIGYCLSWAWIRNFWFRIIHISCIAIVVVQSWIGALCPLTIWETRLREQAGDQTYSGAFIQHWLHSFLYYEAPAWVFTVCYTLIGGLVLASWLIVRPVHNTHSPSSNKGVSSATHGKILWLLRRLRPKTWH